METLVLQTSPEAFFLHYRELGREYQSPKLIPSHKRDTRRSNPLDAFPPHAPIVSNNVRLGVPCPATPRIDPQREPPWSQSNTPRYTDPYPLAHDSLLLSLHQLSPLPHHFYECGQPFAKFQVSARTSKRSGASLVPSRADLNKDRLRGAIVPRTATTRSVSTF